VLAGYLLNCSRDCKIGFRIKINYYIYLTAWKYQTIRNAKLRFYIIEVNEKIKVEFMKFTLDLVFYRKSILQIMNLFYYFIQNLNF